MKYDLGRFHSKAKVIFDRENLSNYKQKIVSFVLDGKGRVLTEGWNSYTKTHPIQKRAAMAHNEEFKCFMHAEIRALTRLSYKQLGKQESIVVLRMDVNKNLIPGKPCSICQGLIRDYAIKNIIHS